MKKISKVLAATMLALVIMTGAKVVPVEAASQSEMAAMISEEMTAHYLYTELYKKYPENKVFDNLAKSEARHIEALKKSASRLGLSTEGAAAAEITIPETKEEALKFALAFEQEDIDMLKKLIENEEDARLKRVFNNLLKASEKHHATLQKAIDEGIDNLNCDQNRSFKNRGENQDKRGGQGGEWKSDQCLGNNCEKFNNMQGKDRDWDQRQGKGQGQGRGKGFQRGGNCINN